jgi:hypothetical protein
MRLPEVPPPLLNTEQWSVQANIVQFQQVSPTSDKQDIANSWRTHLVALLHTWQRFDHSLTLTGIESLPLESQVSAWRDVVQRFELVVDLTPQVFKTL